MSKIIYWNGAKYAFVRLLGRFNLTLNHLSLITVAICILIIMSKASLMYFMKLALLVTYLVVFKSTIFFYRCTSSVSENVNFKERKEQSPISKQFCNSKRKHNKTKMLIISCSHLMVHCISSLVKLVEYTEVILIPYSIASTFNGQFKHTVLTNYDISPYFW